MPSNEDTIVAIATPAGKGGIGIVRLSGSRCLSFCKQLTQCEPKPRFAHYVNFLLDDNQVLDRGLIIYFKHPYSYTGEDMLECHLHGSDVLLQSLLEQLMRLGARPAHPGEFTERAFLNNKLDLIQAEAVAEIIESRSKTAACCAMRSLSGEFSMKIEILRNALLESLVLLEAMIDFPDEDIDNLNSDKIKIQIDEAYSTLESLLVNTKSAAVLNRQLQLVIIGKPNVGKSSLFNTLVGDDAAIVSDLAGTTRDLLHESIHLKNIQLNLIDTAGIRSSDDVLEQAGVARTYQALEKADLILYVADCDDDLVNERLEFDIPSSMPMIVVRNKIDVRPYHLTLSDICPISLRTGLGMDALIEKIYQQLHQHNSYDEDIIMARERHIHALSAIRQELIEAKQCAPEQLELIAERLRQSLLLFDQLTGKVVNDEILAGIFSSFCIGK